MFWNFFLKRKRKLLLEENFPLLWRKILEERLPLYSHLSKEKKEKLENDVKILLGEKTFVGAQGLLVTDEMRVLICAQAAVLLLGKMENDRYFPNVDTIIIYPSTFTSELPSLLGGGFHVKKQVARLGEFSDKTHQIVLSWNSVQHGLENSNDGKNVVLHEFAHQLDSETGNVNGTPLLGPVSAYRLWGATMSHEFAELQEDLKHHHRTFIDAYGATSPAEFFAVLTEAFFEKPHGLKKKHPEVYDLLSKFYEQDPASRS